jgi:phenylalanyl-tRNA synthetase beta chain
MSISLGKTTLVDFGIVNKTLCKKMNVDQDVLFADFNWDNVLLMASKQRFKLNDIPKYPKVRRDFALLLDENVNFSQIDDIAQKTERKLLKDVSLFDVYEGKNLPNGKKSYAVSFILQDENKTLTDKQVDKIMGKLQHQFENQLGAELR